MNAGAGEFTSLPGEVSPGNWSVVASLMAGEDGFCINARGTDLEQFGISEKSLHDNENYSLGQISGIKLARQASCKELN